MERLDSRKETLLHLTVRRYVKTAEPVGSAWLAEESGLDVSPATIRNELAALEEGGYLVQPHTSAGRIPGELGYRYCVAHFLERKKPPRETFESMRETLAAAAEEEERLRRAAKLLAEEARAAALVGFAPRDVYYTGLTNLFSQPEFRQLALVTSMSRVLDHLDDVMQRIHPTIDHGVRVLIGSENPFGAECGALLVKTPNGGVLGLLGPMRMDYEYDMGLLETATELLKT